MNPIIFETTETSFDTYGLGVLHPISCFVEEERNGSYELTLTAALTSQHAEEISVGRFIMAKPNRTDDPQPFRVYNVKKALNGTITANARHLSYDLSGIVLSAFTRYNCGAALQAIADRCAGWTFTTDRSAQAGIFNTAKPASARAWLGGRAGSILDLYGPGEWHFDKYACEFLTARGANRGVVIRYGKNLTALDAETDDQNIASKVQCFYSDANGTTVRGSAVATGQTAIKKTLLIDVTDMFETVPTAADLTTAATNYIASHNVTAPRANFTIDWVQSGEIIDRIDLCDTVTIKYEALGISGTAKCIRTKWNVLLDRYEEIEIGDIKTTLADTLVSVNEKIEQAAEETASAYQQAIEAASNIITGAAGGYVVFWNSSTMAPGTTADPANEILVMDTPSIATATKVWRWNINGLGYSANGYAGPFQTAIDMNGGIATWFIDTVRINADNITVGTLQGVTIIGQNGSIGGWKMTGGILEKWSDYTDGVPSTVYRAFMSAPTNPQENYLAFGVEKYSWNGTTMTLISQPFRVRYDGSMVATNGTFEGTVTARAGSIDGPLTLGSNGSITASNQTGDRIGMTQKVFFVDNAQTNEKLIVGSDGITIFDISTDPSTQLLDIDCGNANSDASFMTKYPLRINAPSVTFSTHSSALGDVKREMLSSAVSIPASTTTALTYITLDKGVWLIFAYVKFSGVSGGGGRRIVNVASTANGTNARIRNDGYSSENAAQQIEASGYLTVTNNGTPYYLNAYSTNACDAMGNYTQITAVRLF